MPLLGEDNVLQTLKQVLADSPGDQKEAVCQSSQQGLTRFAESDVHQNMLIREQHIVFRIAKGKRLGVASTSSWDEAELRKTARAAAEMAEHQPEIPHFQGFVKPAKIRKVKTWFTRTANYSPRKRAQVIRGIFESARKHELRVAGSFMTSAGELAVVNSNGVALYQPLTAASIALYTLSDTASGYANGFSRDVGSLDFDDISALAIKKCVMGRNPKAIDPGKYDVILEPAALAEIMEWMSFIAFGPKAYEDGMSFICGQEGKQLMGDNVTLYDDAFSRDGIPMPFDYEGTPKKKTYFIKKGKAKGVVYDSISAARLGKTSTGHALMPGGDERALPLNICMEPGESSEEEMLASMERGIYITKFHYLNGYLEPRVARMTGMTRDGAFWVENGKIQHGIANMRFTQSMTEALSNVKMISKTRRPTKAWWSDLGAATLPSTYITDFTFTGRQDK